MRRYVVRVVFPHHGDDFTQCRRSS